MPSSKYIDLGRNEYNFRRSIIVHIYILRSSFKEDDAYSIEIQSVKYACRKSDDRKSVDSFHFRWDEAWNVCQGVIGPLAVFHFPSPLSLFRAPRAVRVSINTGMHITKKGKRKEWNSFSFSHGFENFKFRILNFFSNRKCASTTHNRKRETHRNSE